MFSCVQLFVNPWTIAPQTPLFMEFFKQEHWKGLPFPPLGDLPDQGSSLCLLHWQAGSLPLSHQGSPAKQ